MNNLYRWRPRRQIDIDDRIASLIPNTERKDIDVSTQPKEQYTGSMRCTRCEKRTNSLSYGHSRTLENGVCPTCAIITGVSSEDLPLAVTHVLQLIDAGLTDLPIILAELHSRLCQDASEPMRREILGRVARWKKGFSN